MYADKGLAVLLLALSAAVALKTGWPRSKQGRIYRPNLGPRRLIQHVMMHEVQWANVLKEQVKVLGAPPYGGSLNYENDDKGPSILLPPKPKSVVEQGDDEKKEIAGTIASNTVRYIVATVARHFMSVGSFVEYAVEALRLATSCYTMKELVLQISTISMMMVKEHNELDVLAAVIELTKNVVAYIDLLAFWPNDNITVLYNIYWNVVDIIQEETIRSLRQIKYTIKMDPFLFETIKYLNNVIYEQCSDMTLSKNKFYKDTFGVAPRPPLFDDPDLAVLVNLKDLKRMGLKRMKHMDRYVKKLKINTMPSRLWSSVFLDKGYLEETRSDLSETLTEVEKEMSEEYPKTAETISGPSVYSLAMEPLPEGSESADTRP